MADVKLTSIVKRYGGDILAVDDLNLEIRDKEFMVLVGPSGCGKSTTLRMIAGLEEITEGSLEIAGKKVNDVAPRDRDIAMVFQNYALYPHMTVFENMAFGLRIRKIPKAEIQERVGEASKVLGIEDLLERKPKALSGGQRQRVAMGRAIVRNPSVFLFDEPLSNLDAKLRVQMRLELAQLHQRLQTTVVYVTHDQVEAMTLADRITILHGGKLQQVGTPLEVFNTPSNRFVAGFIGSPSMNFFPVKRDPNAPKRTLVGETFTLTLEHDIPGDGVELEMGIRPQAFTQVEDNATDAWVATVNVVERLGPETYVYFSILGITATARLGPDVAIRPGDTIALQPDLTQIHVFDAQGQALLHTRSFY